MAPSWDVIGATESKRTGWCCGPAEFERPSELADG